MAQIVTKTGENTITFDTYYQYIWARNYGETDVYISNHTDIVAGDDDVALLPAGEAVRLTVNGNTLYVLGSTTLEVHAQNFSDSPFAWNEAGEGGGSDITVVALSATENKTYTAPTGTAYSPVTVSVSPNVGTKTITHDGTYNASTDNLDGYSSVTVDTAPHPPTGYTELYYVECPSSGQAGFVVSSYSLGAYDMHECKTMPYEVEDEGAFAGVYTSSAIEFYYADGYANVYASQSSTIINPMGKQMAETNSIYYHRAMKDRNISGDFTIGYYRYNYYPFRGRIYYYKIYRTTNNSEGIELIYNFIPCVRDADGKIGMYDTVNDIFYASTTGTDFVAPSE